MAEVGQPDSSASGCTGPAPALRQSPDIAAIDKALTEGSYAFSW